MIFPCCKQKIPAPLDNVAKATCALCLLSYQPSVIIEYNNLVEIAFDWRSVVTGKAFIKPEPGEVSFVSGLMGRTNKILNKIESASPLLDLQREISLN